MRVDEDTDGDYLWLRPMSASNIGVSMY